MLKLNDHWKIMAAFIPERKDGTKAVFITLVNGDVLAGIIIDDEIEGYADIISPDTSNVYAVAEFTNEDILDIENQEFF